MKSNSIKWSHFNLYTTIQKCERTLAPSIALKQLEINISLPKALMVWGDEIRCEFVFRNILHNAIKYSEFYKQIYIGIKDMGRAMDFYIKDNGVGMSKDQVNKMFKLDNTRVSSRGTLNEQGAGIGLLLCHDFIESLGWSLQVESEEGVGTTFHVYIPKHNNPPEITQEPTTKQNPSLQLQ